MNQFHLNALLLALCSQVASLSGASYYVDSQSGDDRHDGRSETTAWKTLEPVNRTVFQPSDHIRFKAGTRYRGQFRPQGSGQLVDGQPAPIRVAAYGSGARPRIDADGEFLDAVLLRNVEYWEIQDLEITNLGARREPGRTGARILAEGCGTLHHLVLSNLFVHDVNSDLSKQREGCGIFFEAKGGAQSCFDGLRIENCHLARTDRNGICQRRGRGAARSLNVVIRGNLLEDIGGDGIKPWGSNGALVEHNTLRGGRTRCDDYAAGIWPWDCDDTLIQFNEVSGMKGIKDGQAFDSDYRCRNTVFQYNYSHDNEGGFMLICSPGNSYCEGTVIRYNLSQNDGLNTARIFHLAGGIQNTWIYNNVIYVGANQDLPLVRCTEWSQGWPVATHFYNNIFYVEGRVTYDWGQSKETIWEHNVVYGNHEDPPQDSQAVTNQPPLRKAGSGGNGFGSVSGYRLKPGARFIRGKSIANAGARDFFGAALPANRPPHIGICEEAP